jgi:glutamate mutase epsilon subunit
MLHVITSLALTIVDVSTHVACMVPANPIACGQALPANDQWQHRYRHYQHQYQCQCQCHIDESKLDHFVELVHQLQRLSLHLDLLILTLAKCMIPGTYVFTQSLSQLINYYMASIIDPN